MGRNEVPSQTPPSSATLSGTVGAQLREARVKAGLDLKIVADKLRIRHVFLAAIEEDRYQDLPGATYASGFVRTYAEHLGLDGDEMVRRFHSESAHVPRSPDLEFPIAVKEGGLPSGVVILLALLLAGVVYGGWVWSNSLDRPLRDVVQDLPERFSALMRTEPDRKSVDETASQVALPPPVVSPLVAEPSPAVTPLPEAVVPEGNAPVEQPTMPSAQATPSVVGGDATGAAVPSTHEAAGSATPSPVVGAPGPAFASADHLVTSTPATQAPVTPASPAAAPSPASSSATAPVLPPVVPAPTAAPAASSPVASAPTTAPVAAGAATPPAAAPAATSSTPTPAVSSSVPAAEGRVYGEENADARVLVRAKADSWIQVRVSNELVLSRLLRAGESYRVPNRAGVELMTGNAGGVVIEVDGKVGGPLGKSGEVRRGISLDPEALKKSVE